ncbi:MAG: M24 family metallopeptidase [Oceanipulchritudo sp.]
MAKGNSAPFSSEVLLYADSESNADMLYFGGVFVPDPFIAFSCKGRRVAVVSQLEFARVGMEGRFDEVISLEEASEMAGRKATRFSAHPAGLIAFLAWKYRIPAFRIAPDFPVRPAFALKELGIRLEIAEDLLFPERERKTDEEARFIREGNAASAAGFRVVEKLLREAEIRRGFLHHGGGRLTSERMREAIAVECLKRGAVASRVIVAAGDQACDPHCVGHGPLRANELVIVDIFPRVARTGYHGDMTRTYLKGRASEAQKALYQTVYEAEQTALGEHRAGRSGSAIYKRVRAFFSRRGYPTRRENGVPVGFIHGLGHGLGLEVHEPPRVNQGGTRLKTGQVITVEPGLYYPGLGGARVEDVVRVSGKGPELLSKHPYRWRIR